MARLIPAAERIKQAHALIEEARRYPIPERGGKYDLSYMAHVRGLLRQARELVQFIPKTPSATPEIKAEAMKVIEDAERVGHEIFRGS
jgi:hypothetical protein